MKPSGWVNIDRVFIDTMMVVDTNGFVGDIIRFLDGDGQPTNDLDIAHIAVVRWKHSGKWSPVEIIAADRQKLH